jgi:3-dehydrotetronate 4-kinase
MSKPLLGCIADDFTGATDLANNLVRAGMRVVQTIGVPDASGFDGDADAVVVALKTRTIPPHEAVAQSLSALRWLQAAGATQIYFKYCSTFDSTPEGNIGPVTDALMQALQTDFTIACPAFPDNGRTVFKGYLFVGDELLHESGMRNHPLTPMTDSNLVRVLQAQTPNRVGLIDHRTVTQGADAVRQRMAELRARGVAIAVVDATSNAQLMQAGSAWKDLPLVTAGSGLAIGLPQNFGFTSNSQASQLPPAAGNRAIVSGSCSTTTNLQVQSFIAAGGAAFAIDPLRLAAGEDLISAAMAWARPWLDQGRTVLVYASAEPAAVKATQAVLGVQPAGDLVERALAAIARALVQQGVRQLVVAGGETSGACVQALGLQRLRIGPQIAPGVPWCYGAVGNAPQASLHIALKSGNFGDVTFFTQAFDCLN